MKRSNIPKEKLLNKSNLMNHRITSADGNSELIKHFSIETKLVNCDRVAYGQGSDNKSFSEHIYENVPHASKRKHKTLSELVISLKSRTRDLNLRKYVKKFVPKMIENNDACDDNLLSSINGNRDEEVDDVSSYTSCQEENVYENLNFDIDHSDDDEAITDNDALNCWLENLAMEVEDYESSDPMTTKCIPSRQRSVSCSFDEDFIERLSPRLQSNAALEEYKLEILNKCFNAIWQQESENEVLNNLYVFLNDIFSSFFRRNSSQNVPKETTKDENVVIRKRRGRANAYNSDIRKGVDKKTVEKLETFILSVSLNRQTITYDKCLKFYFAFKSSQTYLTLDNEVRAVLKLCQAFFNLNQVELTSENLSFLKTLKLILWNKVTVRKVTADANFGEVSDVKHKKIVKEENIYQPIWKWHTDCKPAIICDNIYASLEFIVERDDNDWEVDSEFCFLDAKKPRQVSCENMFKTVNILICQDNPELNIIDYSNHQLSSDVTNIVEVKNDNENYQPKDLIDNKEVLSANEESNSVKAWKELIRGSFYCEDEEDLIMSAVQIASIKASRTESEAINIPIVQNENAQDNNVPKSKLITTSVGSFNIKSTSSDVLNVEQVQGKFRNISENDSNNNTSLESMETVDSKETVEEPKKEGFRDKMRGKFKLKSSKPSPANNETVEVTKEVDEEYFATNLGNVEKDLEQKSVPKLVVDCINVLETDSNLKTPGLYRVSGNKTIIEAFKKKSNDKKSTKKDPKYSSLKNQDVHSVTGILKMFFRELSPPLVPTEVFNACTTDAVTHEQIGSLLRKIPETNYETLKYLMGHLKRVEKNKKENLMNSGNLAICWGLCIFSSSFDATNEFFENDISRCNVLCKRMIDHFGTIFST